MEIHMVSLPFLKTAAAESETQRDAYVHTALLSGLDDVFNPDLLWSAPTAFRWGSRSVKSVIESMRCRHGAGELVPASVLLELPAEKVERDRRIGGQLTLELVSVLTQRHSRDFKDSLPEGMQPRYAVHSARDVPPGHVRVRLGPAIHVPQQGEAAVWKVQTSLDGVVWDAAPPVLLTEHQRLFILSGSVENGSQLCANWPFDPQLGLVLLNLPGESRLDVSAEPLGSLNIGWNDAADCHVVRSPDAGPDSPCLYLRATRLVPVALPDVPSRAQVSVAEPTAQQRAAARQTAEVLARHTAPARPAYPAARVDPALGPNEPYTPVAAACDAPVMLDPEPPVAPAATPEPDVAPPAAAHEGAELTDAPTLVASLPQAVPLGLDDAPTMLAMRPVHFATLSLEGLAVQRPSLFAAAGVRGVQWGLDAAGGVVAPQSTACALRFNVSAQDELRVATAAGSRVLAVGEAVPLKGGAIVLRLQALPAPLGDNYLGWLHLPLGRPARIEYGKSVGVGRQLESLKPLQPLAGTGFLTDVPDTSGDRMGLSRKHFELQPTPEGLVVRALGSNTVAHLDERMQFVATVTAEQPALLADRHCLVVGHYVWRFNA
jgi:hypothetical protein